MTDPIEQKNGVALVQGIIALICLIGGLWYFVGGGLESRVADDAVEEYNLAKRSGTKMDRCVHAGIVAAAYSQAKDEENYRRWKNIERVDCVVAGLPVE